jgi:arylsulfatase A-like enzyme
VVSDHGEGLGDHGRLGHGENLHGEVLDVVFLLNVPGLPPAQLDHPARTLDVAPTLLELLDVDPGPAHFQGQSLVPLLRGEALAAEPSFSQAVTRGERRHSVRRDPWRLIVEDESGLARLYDLERDPDELVDVSDEHPGVVADLRALLACQEAADDALRERLGADLEESALDADTLRDLERLGYTGTSAQ